MQKFIHYLRYYPIHTKERLLFSSIAGLVYLIACIASPRLFSVIEPDSMGYLNFTAIRTSGYPIFLNLLQTLGIPIERIGFVQLPLFAFSVSYLLFTVCTARIPLSISLTLYVALIANVFLNAFHFTVLTESISFSILLILLSHFILFIINRDIRNLFIASVCVGLLITIRPAAIALAPGLLISGFALLGNAWKQPEYWRKVRSTGLVIIIPIIALIGIESLIHGAVHEKRQSLLPIHLFGKAAIITTFDNFSDKTAPSDLRSFIQRMDGDFEVVSAYLASVQNPFLRMERYADYENFGYYAFLQNEQNSYAKALKISVSDLQKRIGWWAISSHPLAYAKLSIIHYFSLLNVAAPTDFAPGAQPPPYIPSDTFGQGFRLPAVHFAFLGLGISFLAVSIWYGLRIGYTFIFSPEIHWSLWDTIAVNLLLWVHGLQILTATTSLATPRYLMFSYPMMILALLLFVYAIVESKLKTHDSHTS